MEILAWIALVLVTFSTIVMGIVSLTKPTSTTVFQTLFGVLYLVILIDYIKIK